jgi:hypothetical protein
MSLPTLIKALGAPDYHDWLAIADLPEERKSSEFERNIMPYLCDYVDGSPLSKAVEGTSWLVDFVRPSSNLETALEALEERPNRTTTILVDFVKHLAATIITVAWQANMRDFVDRAEAVCNGLRTWLTQYGRLTKALGHECWKNCRGRRAERGL